MIPKNKKDTVDIKKVIKVKSKDNNNDSALTLFAYMIENGEKYILIERRILHSKPEYLISDEIVVRIFKNKIYAVTGLKLRYNTFIAGAVSMLNLFKYFKDI